MKKYKVTAVSYLNTKPFLYGIFQNRISEQIELTLDIPSVCAKKLQSGEADLGLVPVAVIPELNDPRLISDFCIGANGAVKTVCLYSDVPIQHVQNVYLDFHSKTSVNLLKVLLQKYWHVSPNLIPATEGFIGKINGTTAGLVIGDRTIGLEENFEYVYDLAEIWHQWTSMPFVFAAWVSNKTLPEKFVKDFNNALADGLAHIPELIYLLPTQYFAFDLNEYFTKHISYNFDSAKKQALNRFLFELKNLNTHDSSKAIMAYK